MVSFAADYQHHIEGRLRIKVLEVKRRDQLAAHLERDLRGFPGVRDASANPVTGNVLVLFHPEQLTRLEIVERIRGLGMLRQTTPVARPGFPDGSSLVKRVATDLAVAACGELLKVSVRAMVMAML